MKITLQKKTLTSLMATSRQRLGWGVSCAILLGGCGGGGGGEALVPEAVVTSVDAAQVLEGSTGTITQLNFSITLDKPVVRALEVNFHTESTAKSGLASTGSATGGAACGTSGTDYKTVTNAKITLPAGATTGTLTVTVCGDTVFESDESLKVVWSSTGAAGGGVTGTILNDDAGGVGGTGATELLGGLAPFGRDTQSLTNSNDDGPLGFSFTNRQHNVSCTLDRVSGLTWQSPVPTAPVNYAALAASMDQANKQAACGYSDWRMPTANELLSLMNAASTSGNAPNADRTGSADAMTGRYWTGESGATATADAWYLDASNGGAISVAAKTDSNAIRLVRGTPTSELCDNSDGRFINFADGTVEDKNKGLMWKQCPEGSSGNACSSGSASAFSSAAQLVAQLNAANVAGSASGLGYADWRIPTRNEMASLLARNCTGRLAAPASIMPLNGTLNFATATLDADAPTTRLWSVNFLDGSIGQTLMSTPMHLRLVRAGQ